MDWFPLFNSMRIAALSTLIVLFPGLFAARWVAQMPTSPSRHVWNALFMLPLVLPPPAAGWLVLQTFGPDHMIGYWMRQIFDVNLLISWQLAAFTSALMSFPLMYRMSLHALRSVDPAPCEIARTLGCTDAWIFWRVQVPLCEEGILAGTALSFARALGEYGAVYMLSRGEDTISGTIFSLWTRDDPTGAFLWTLLGFALSAAFLLTVSVLEGTRKGAESR